MCVGGECASAQGSGGSCASPFVWDLASGDHAGFRLSFAPTTFVHPCGPLTAVPTKWFRFTSPRSDTTVSVKPDVLGDQLVLTVFSSSACDETVVVGCSNDKKEPKVAIPNAQNKTFFVAVGAVSATAGAGADIRVDK